MDRAVVPVAGTENWPFAPLEGTVGLSNTTVINGSHVALRGSSGKLTKEDIDTMSATLFKETSGPGYVHLTRADTKRIAAAMAVSIGLEVED